MLQAENSHHSRYRMQQQHACVHKELCALTLVVFTAGSCCDGIPNLVGAARSLPVRKTTGDKGLCLEYTAHVASTTYAYVGPEFDHAFQL